MIDLDELISFLLEANVNTYASGSSQIIVKESDESNTFIYEQKSWKYHNNFFGGDPLAGRIIVFLKNKPVFFMAYYGSVEEDYKEVDEVYSVLKEALLHATPEMPFRGPSGYRTRGFYYKNNIEGDPMKFSGEEVIYKEGAEVYRAKYFGGLVDQR
jgi:hypothetical protein